MEKKMSSLIKKIKKYLPYLASILIIINLIFFFYVNEKIVPSDETIIKILTKNESILPRVLEKLEETEKQNTEKKVSLYFNELIKNDNLFLGNNNGNEVIIEFFDYNCGYCKRSFSEIMDLISDNKNIKIILKELPVLGESSILASKASIASKKQGKYFEFHQQLMNFSGPITFKDIKKISEKLKINFQKLENDMNSNETIILLNENYRLAELIGVRGTPAFIIGNKLIPGAIGKNEMLSLLNK